MQEFCINWSLELELSYWGFGYFFLLTNWLDWRKEGLWILVIEQNHRYWYVVSDKLDMYLVLFSYYRKSSLCNYSYSERYFLNRFSHKENTTSLRILKWFVPELGTRDNCCDNLAQFKGHTIFACHITAKYYDKKCFSSYS